MLSRTSTNVLRADSRLSLYLQIADKSLPSHGIREQLKLEGNSADWPVWPLYLKQGHLESAVQGHTQTSFDVLSKDGDSMTILGNLCQYSASRTLKIFLTFRG